MNFILCFITKCIFSHLFNVGMKLYRAQYKIHLFIYFIQMVAIQIFCMHLTDMWIPCCIYIEGIVQGQTGLQQIIYVIF